MIMFGISGAAGLQSAPPPHARQGGKVALGPIPWPVGAIWRQQWAKTRKRLRDHRIEGVCPPIATPTWRMRSDRVRVEPGKAILLREAVSLSVREFDCLRLLRRTSQPDDRFNRRFVRNLPPWKNASAWRHLLGGACTIITAISNQASITSGFGGLYRDMYSISTWRAFLWARFFVYTRWRLAFDKQWRSGACGYGSRAAKRLQARLP